MTRVLAGLLALLLACPVWAGQGEGIRVRLAQPPVLRGQFEQSKQLQGFRHPLVSRGDFLLLRERGVAWDTREPFASTTLLTRDRLLTRLPDGSQRVLLDTAESPGTAAVNALLMALVSGDLPALAERFELEEHLDPTGDWRLLLRPRQDELKQVFSLITLRGDRFVREVLIEEAGGDVTTLRFVALSDAPATATPEEASRFD
ncbi:outer membrane lipoprotein carrier protein LolA [Arenimonas alkanexedens]